MCLDPQKVQWDRLFPAFAIRVISKRRGAGESHSFVNLKRDIRTHPDGLGYHNCRGVRSARNFISKDDKKGSYDSCRTARQKAHTCLSARKWNRYGTTFRHRLTAFFRELGPYPGRHTKISDRSIAKDITMHVSRPVVIHVHAPESQRP